MKKLLVSILIISLLLSVNTFAVTQSSYKCTIYKNDMSGENFKIYLMRCEGHYSNDTVTVYITNTSKKTMKFQVMVGYGGANVQTTVESGYVEIPPEVTGRFELTELSKYPEKTNDDLGYRPGSKLNGNSVVQISVQGCEAGSTFVITGIARFQNSRNSNYVNFKNADAIQPYVFVPAYVTQSKLVIKKEVEEKDQVSYEYTLQQPDNDTIKTFFDITIASGATCLVAIGIYTVCHFIKRRKNND